jgi:uncharacterized protein
MSWRAFRLHEMHRRIDDEIRMAQNSRRPDPFRITRLKTLKSAIRSRLCALARPLAAIAD